MSSNIDNFKNIFCETPLTVVRLHNEQGKHHIKEYDEEQGATHISFLKRITDSEIMSLFGDKTNYYRQMETFYKRDNNVSALQYVRKLMSGGTL